MITKSLYKYSIFFSFFFSNFFATGCRGIRLLLLILGLKMISAFQFQPQHSPARPKVHSSSPFHPSVTCTNMVRHDDDIVDASVDRNSFVTSRTWASFAGLLLPIWASQPVMAKGEGSPEPQFFIDQMKQGTSLENEIYIHRHLIFLCLLIVTSSKVALAFTEILSFLVY